MSLILSSPKSVLAYFIKPKKKQLQNYKEARIKEINDEIQQLENRQANTKISLSDLNKELITLRRASY